MKLWEYCEAQQAQLVQWRRDLHQIPETGLSLPETAAYVAAALDALEIPYRKLEDSMLCAQISGGASGKTVALRADMDALPIREETGVDYCSRTDGCMHACGHDAHIAMLLGAAKILQAHRRELSGSVRLIFQSAEEIGKGAVSAIGQHVLDGVDAIFGMHIGTLIDNSSPAGTIFYAEKACMASFDSFQMDIHGFGCHGSTPEKGIDPVNIAMHISMALQSVVSREFSATEPVVISIGAIHSGVCSNIIPDTAFVTGTIRCTKELTRKKVAERIRSAAEGIAAVFGGSVRVEILPGAPALINDPSMSQFVYEAAKEVVGEQRITRMEKPNMGGEDFAYYTNTIPGAYFFLGSANAEKSANYPHHHPKFQIDEDVLWKGSAMFSAIAEQFLKA